MDTLLNVVIYEHIQFSLVQMTILNADGEIDISQYDFERLL